MVGPKVRLGTKWLSITSTCTQSALGIRATSAPRAAKSALRMLGVIWMPTSRDPSMPPTRGSAGGSDVGQVGRGRGVALGGVAVGPPQKRRDVEHVAVDALMEVAELRVALRDREDREVVGVAVGDLVPAHRRRDPGVGQAPHRVRRRDGVVAGVLVVVDEQVVGVAVLLP